MAEKLKVAMIAPNLSGNGGTETVIRQVLQSEQLQSKMKFSLFLPDPLKYDYWFNVIQPLLAHVQIASQNKLMRVIRKFTFYITTDADIVIVLGMKSIFIAWFMRLVFFKKYRIVSWIHFTLQQMSFSKPRFLKFADAHLAISSGIKRQLADLGISKDRIFLIFNPAEKTSQQISLTQTECVHFIFLGRIEFNKQKNIQLMLDGLSKVKYLWQLDVYGSGEDLNRCKKYARKLNIDSHINWFGWVADPWTHVNNADALLLTSNFEGLPMVIIESLQRGVPVIASDCKTGPEDEIVDGQNGLLFETGNLEEFIMKLNEFKNRQTVFTNQPSIRQSVGKFDLSVYERKFDQALDCINKKQV